MFRGQMLYRLPVYCGLACVATLPFVLISLWASSDVHPGKKYATLTNEQSLMILNQVEADLKANYYDPKMHGVDLDARFTHAREQVAAAKSQDDALLDIAAAVFSLNDSHTRFVPPARPYGVDYGWLGEAIGEADCYIAAVRPASDAAMKGVRPGDKIASINGVSVSRANLAEIEYSYQVFPQSGLHLQVEDAEGTPRSLVVLAKVMPGQPWIRHADFGEWIRSHSGIGDRSRYFNLSDKVLLWKVPDFFIDPNNVDNWLGKIRRYDTVVLDLRGNPGGRVDTASKFTGIFFNRDIAIGEIRGRSSSTSQTAKGSGSKSFEGKLIVLIDSKSSSGAEVFARVVQLEKRGIVLGDRSRGAVAEARLFPHTVELSPTTVTAYQTEITIANLVMADGRSLEKIGVTPDERILPIPEDLRMGRDPVLARASELAGVPLTSEAAGKILPFVWPKEVVP